MLIREALKKKIHEIFHRRGEATPDFVDGGHLDREDDNLERQLLGNSCSLYADSRWKDTFLVDFTVCTLQTG